MRFPLRTTFARSAPRPFGSPRPFCRFHSVEAWRRCGRGGRSKVAKGEIELYSFLETISEIFLQWWTPGSGCRRHGRNASEQPGMTDCARRWTLGCLRCPIRGTSCRGRFFRDEASSVSEQRANATTSGEPCSGRHRRVSVYAAALPKPPWRQRSFSFHSPDSSSCARCSTMSGEQGGALLTWQRSVPEELRPGVGWLHERFSRLHPPGCPRCFLEAGGDRLCAFCSCVSSFSCHRPEGERWTNRGIRGRRPLWLRTLNTNRHWAVIKKIVMATIYLVMT